MSVLKAGLINALEDHELDLLKSWIHQWGSSFSEAVLEGPCHIYKTNDIEGFIGYLPVCRCAVVYGDPICSNEEVEKLATAFHHFCEERKLSIVYISVSESFAKWAVTHTCKVLMEIGEEVILDPLCNPSEGPGGRRLRYKINHALNAGLIVEEYTEKNVELEKAIQGVCDSWLKSRQGPQIHLGEVDFFKHRTGKRWLYVRNQDGHVIGAALLSRIEMKKGWLLKYLIHVPNAPRGTSELLMISLLKILNEEGCRYLTYGMIVSENLKETRGLNTFSLFIAKLLFKIAKKIFNLSERKTYWQKFLPDTEPRYLLFSKNGIGIRELYALSMAMKID